MPFKMQKRVFILLRYFLLAGLLTFLSYQFYAHAMGDKLFLPYMDCARSAAWNPCCHS